jgi:GT2 family glycosyltransferase
MRKEKIAANVVTYNRKELLKGCLNALLKQSRKPDLIIVVDNNSTDGTREMLEKEFLSDPIFDYVRLEENTGSAGGQYTGIKRAYEKGFDWVWCMDDDVLSRETALEELRKSFKYLADGGERNIGFLCSHVISKEGMEMNVPKIDTCELGNKYPQWGKYSNEGIIKVVEATFVSILLPRYTISKVGFPLKKFFIWGDDTEYTRRISKVFPCYFSGKSVVTHFRKMDKPPNIVEEKDPRRIAMYFYKFRNRLFIAREFGSSLDVLKRYTGDFYTLFLIAVKSKDYKFQRLRTVVKALFTSINSNLEN